MDTKESINVAQQGRLSSVEAQHAMGNLATSCESVDFRLFVFGGGGVLNKFGAEWPSRVRFQCLVCNFLGRIQNSMIPLDFSMIFAIFSMM